MFSFKSAQKNKVDTSPVESLSSRLRAGLKRTKTILLADMGNLLDGKKSIDDAFLENLEDHLLMADVGVDATAKIIDAVQRRTKLNEPEDPERLRQVLHDIMVEILHPVNQPLRIPDTNQHKPFVILMIGVNGSGKTTSIGKLAHHYLNNGQSIMLAAGDTYRAAAVEQLQAWGERNQVPVIAQQSGADSAAVIYDALQAARARDIDILIVDTAGRLHTQGNLMDELKKVRRVISKFDEEIAVECMLVVDAGTGQNVLAQAKQFHEAIGVTGITLTKLDGTAKGGVIFALAMAMQIPVRYIGVGEQLNDLQEFNDSDFVGALLESQT